MSKEWTWWQTAVVSFLAGLVIALLVGRLTQGPAYWQPTAYEAGSCFPKPAQEVRCVFSGERHNTSCSITDRERGVMCTVHLIDGMLSTNCDPWSER